MRTGVGPLKTCFKFGASQAKPLTAAFGASPAGVDIPSIFNVVAEPEFALLPAWAKLDEDQPRAFLNYLLFDNIFVLQEFDFDQVSTDAESMKAAHEKLMLELNIERRAFYTYTYRTRAIKIWMYILMI